MQAALAEISRVLKPGGMFVASTFLTPLASLGELVGDDAVRPLVQVGPAPPPPLRCWNCAERRLVVLLDCSPLRTSTPPPPPPQGLNPFGARSSQYRFWEEAELRELCDAVGLADWQRSRSRSFIMFAARKPQ